MQDEEKRGLGPELRRHHGWPELGLKSDILLR